MGFISGPYRGHRYGLDMAAISGTKIATQDLATHDFSAWELELYNERLDAWERFCVDRFAVDGRVRLERCDGERAGAHEWRDLSRERYRWLVAAAVSEVPA